MSIKDFEKEHHAFQADCANRFIDLIRDCIKHFYFKSGGAVPRHEIIVQIPMPVIKIILEDLETLVNVKPDADLLTIDGLRVIPGYQYKIVVYWENFQYTMDKRYLVEFPLGGKNSIAYGDPEKIPPIELGNSITIYEGNIDDFLNK